jgi:hypothetical protein
MKRRKLNLCPKTARAAKRNHVVVSDMHIGSTLGLCHPAGYALDDGGTYKPSDAQDTMWGWWEMFWHEWVPRVTNGEPWTLVINGDAKDGDHHETPNIISRNPNDEQEHAVRILRPIVEMCEGRYYHVRGTVAHVGQAGHREEQLAHKLGAIPNEIGQHARYELYLRCGDEKGTGLVHYAHHIGTTSSSSYESTAVHKELVEAYVEAGRWGDETPQVVVRSHRHRNYEVRIPTRHGYGIALVTPAWQLKTPFVAQLGMKQSRPQIGGCIVRQGDEELHTRSWVWSVQRPKEV